jgi:hypothetical protein
MKRYIMVVLSGFCVFAIAAHAEIGAISEQVTDVETFTNDLGRAYEIDSIWFSPSAETSQSVTLSVVVGGVQYDQKVLTVAGDTAWTANQIVSVPAGAALKLDSDQAAVTNDVYIIRSEASTTRTFVDGQLADGEVDTAELAADAVTGAKIADEAIDSEHYVDGSIDTVHFAADAVDGTKIADDAVDSEHIAAGAIDLAHMSAESVDSDQYVDDSVDVEHVSFDLSGLSPTGDDGGFFQVTGTALQYVSSGGVTNEIVADITQ